MTPPRVDLISDTATRPTPGMRRAMAEAEVGDEQRGEDPTVCALNARVAELLGQEAAIFLPSGTMCNQIALAVHCRPGDEIIAAATAHIIGSEGAGAAVFAGAVVHGIVCEGGIFTATELERAIRPRRTKSPRSRVVAVEQTTNRGGGQVWPLATIREVVDVAREHGLSLHMDGARLANACVASGVAASEFAALFDSVWLDLSKGLGCPVGGVLAGSQAFIEEADVWKHRFGGAMRQAGILAAAGLYALDRHVDRLAEDHENASAFAQRISQASGVAIVGGVGTNLVFFDVAGSGLTARTVAERIAAQGVRIGVEGPTRLRAVFHLDIDAAAAREAAEAVIKALSPQEGCTRGTS